MSARGLALLLAALLGTAPGCTALWLAFADRYPAGQAIEGPGGGYAITPPSGAWVRRAGEEDERVDLALARDSRDAVLSVAVEHDSVRTKQGLLARVRGVADSVMEIAERREEPVRVPAPDGEREGQLGHYCGRFDRDMMARRWCFTILALEDGRTSYVVVGQARSEGGRVDEVERFVRSFVLVAPRPDAAEAEGA